MKAMGDTILTVENLAVNFYNDRRCNRALCGVSFSVKRGSILGVVGESGCGKSVTALAITRLLPPFARIEGGRVMYHGLDADMRLDTLAANGKQIRALRGAEIAMIFQDPMISLNPVYSVGFQIGENLQYHTHLRKKARDAETVNLLREMGIPDPDIRAWEYPHEFSGGMRQRAMIAMAVAAKPKLLIADEPTTALDVTIQAQIFTLLDLMKRERGMSIMLITHDMAVIAALADAVIVMYMGEIVEQGSAVEILNEAAHPYTQALLRSLPVLGRGKQQNLVPIRGHTPGPFETIIGCQFAPRCDEASPRCFQPPVDFAISATHTVRCWERGFHA